MEEEVKIEFFINGLKIELFYTSAKEAKNSIKNIKKTNGKIKMFTYKKNVFNEWFFSSL